MLIVSKAAVFFSSCSKGRKSPGQAVNLLPEDFGAQLTPSVGSAGLGFSTAPPAVGPAVHLCSDRSLCKKSPLEDAAWVRAAQRGNGYFHFYFWCSHFRFRLLTTCTDCEGPSAPANETWMYRGFACICVSPDSSFGWEQIRRSLWNLNREPGVTVSCWTQCHTGWLFSLLYLYITMATLFRIPLLDFHFYAVVELAGRNKYLSYHLQSHWFCCISKSFPAFFF